MPKKIPVIKDIAVVAVSEGGLPPIGEAPVGMSPSPTSLMVPDERAAMIDRLQGSVFQLMDKALGIHDENSYILGSSTRDPLYITRISTNEFFYYTQEPLALEEFERLHNKIADKAKTLPSGIQLILGSFAVKTADNSVMNVTPHITCGATPDIHFIMKNHTSTIDVRYKVPSSSGEFRETLGVLDVTTHDASAPMPRITINGKTKEFTFNNIVPCKTPDGTPFITGVDVCCDQLYGIARFNYEKLKKSHPAIVEQPVSYVVISNFVYLDKVASLSSEVMHVDPISSPRACKSDVAQISDNSLEGTFGRQRAITYVLAPTRLTSHLENPYPHKSLSNSFVRPHGAYEVSLDSDKFNGFKRKYGSAKGDHLKTEILNDFKVQIEKTFSTDELTELKERLMSSRECEILKTGQGAFTRLTGIKTSSIVALENMFQQQEKYLASPDYGRIHR